MPETAAPCSHSDPITWIDGLEPHPVCPVREVPAWSWLLSAWRWCGEGRLPRAGGVLDQPAWVLDALDAVTAAVAEQRRRERGDGPDGER